MLTAEQKMDILVQLEEIKQEHLVGLKRMNIDQWENICKKYIADGQETISFDNIASWLTRRSYERIKPTLYA